MFFFKIPVRIQQNTRFRPLPDLDPTWRHLHHRHGRGLRGQRDGGDGTHEGPGDHPRARREPVGPRRRSGWLSTRSRRVRAARRAPSGTGAASEVNTGVHTAGVHTPQEAEQRRDRSDKSDARSLYLGVRCLAGRAPLWRLAIAVHPCRGPHALIGAAARPRGRAAVGRVAAPACHGSPWAALHALGRPRRQARPVPPRRHMCRHGVTRVVAPAPQPPSELSQDGRALKKHERYATPPWRLICLML